MTNPPAHIWDIRKFEDAPAAIEAFCHDAQQKWMEVNKVEGSRIKDVLKDYRTLFKSQAKKHKEHKDLLEDLRKYIARVKAEAVRQELEAELSARISEGSTRGSDGTNKENNTKAKPEDLADIGDVVDTLQKVTLTLKERSNSIASVKKEKIELKDELEAAKSTMKEQNTVIDTNRRVIAKQNIVIDEKNAVIKAKKEKISKDKDALAEKDEVIAKATDAITEKDEAIAKARDAIAEKEKVIAETNTAITEKEKIITEKENIIGNLKKKQVKFAPQTANRSNSMSRTNRDDLSANPIASKLDGSVSQNRSSDPDLGKRNIDASLPKAPGSNNQTVSTEVTQSKVTLVMSEGSAQSNAIQATSTTTQTVVQTADQVRSEMAEGGSSKKRKVHPTDPSAPDRSTSDSWQVMAKNAYDIVCSLHPDEPLDFTDMIRVWMIFVNSDIGLSGRHEWQDCGEYTCLNSLIIDETKETAIGDDKCAKCLEKRGVCIQVRGVGGDMKLRIVGECLF
ncbi:hypothetical protein BKA61DRAFT_707013 [Leptodontidium sp. MPI-SDFR-AT-0119]|nr:hypothetical protein BKA61DRAFT_707013 [Leptodontidium sp. MPI-SDFR-AT-0119]